MLIDNSKKIVLKLGSSTVVDKKGKFKKKWVISLIKDIKKYTKEKNVVIVSSGAIALGQTYLKIKKKKNKTRNEPSSGCNWANTSIRGISKNL